MKQVGNTVQGDPESSSGARPPDLAVIASLKSWGGIEGKLVTLFREFLARGLRPELVCIRGGEVPYPDRIPSEVTIVKLATRSKRDGVPAIIRYLRERRPSAVLTAKDHSAQVALLARTFGRLETPIFVKVTNTLSLVARRRLQRWMIRRLYPKATGIIANSTGVADDLEQSFGLPRDSISIIYNPTVSNDTPARAATKIDHPWFASPDERPVILGVGRMTPQKDFPTLMSAFAQVRRLRDCRLVILGDGAGRPELERKARDLGIAEDVDLPGFVPDVLPYMARASVFALSSRYEGLSNVLIEALAVGTPAVATDCPSGSAEILDHGRYGRLVPVGDARALAAALEAALDEPRPSEAQVQEATRRFQAEIVAGQYLRTLGLLDG